MAQKWHQKASVQTAIVTGVFIIAAAVITGIFTQKSKDTPPDTLNKVETTASPTDISKDRKYFYVRLHSSLVSVFPGQLVYVYDSKIGKLIAPIGVAMVVEVINNRSSLTKIHSYTVDLEIHDEWTRIYNLSILNPMEIYWVNNGNFKTCTRLDFRSNSFDVVAREQSLKPGESLKGWMFFEWPIELRKNIPNFKKVRIQIENSQGEKETFILDSVSPQETGQSMLTGGELIVPPQSEKIDLSNFRLMPEMDLLKGFRDGSIK
jgi:hypothetical protein